jgi:RND family efflux transporter MFP subunit
MRIASFQPAVLFLSRGLCLPRLTVGAACALVALATVACGGAPAPAGPPGGGAPAMPVEIVTLAPKPVERIAEFVGTIKSRRSTTIQPQAEGFLVRILVTSGARVQTGTPLFEIDAPAERAALAGLQSTRVARQADAEFARQQADRAKSLLAVGAMSQQEYEQASTAQRTAEAQLQAAEEQIRQQQAQLAYFRVVAPAPGVVGDVPVRVGDRVTRSTVLTTLDDNSSLELYVNVPVQEAANLRMGLPVRLVSATGDTLATEAVNYVSAAVDDATQTVLVKTPVRAPAGQFRTEQTVRAVVVFSEEPGLTVPVTAATRINGRYFVFLAEAGEGGATVARQKPIGVGRVVGNEYVVTDGLEAGNRLIVGGIQKIGDGSPVTIVPAAQGGR